MTNNRHVTFFAFIGKFSFELPANDLAGIINVEGEVFLARIF